MRAKGGAPKFILVGNKVDNEYSLHWQREVTTDEGRQKAHAWGCAFFETSALTRDGVEEAFTRVVRELRGTVVEEPEVAREPSCWSKCVIL
jgi:GTPase SAR1 family protein